MTPTTNNNISISTLTFNRQTFPCIVSSSLCPFKCKTTNREWLQMIAERKIGDRLECIFTRRNICISIAVQYNQQKNFVKHKTIVCLLFFRELYLIHPIFIGFIVFIVCIVNDAVEMQFSISCEMKVFQRQSKWNFISNENSISLDNT